MDTIFVPHPSLLENQHPLAGGIMIYFIIIVFELFIPSGSAKAVFMPIIFELCNMSGIHPQVAVLAFAFADGFSNILHPTNAGLLLILGMTTVDYGKWFKWSVKIQLALFAASVAMLAFARWYITHKKIRRI